MRWVVTVKTRKQCKIYWWIQWTDVHWCRETGKNIGAERNGKQRDSLLIA